MLGKVISQLKPTTCFLDPILLHTHTHTLRSNMDMKIISAICQSRYNTVYWYSDCSIIFDRLHSLIGL